MPNGAISGPYYSFTRRDFVIIAATTEDGRYICVKQFRPGVRRVTAEFCAGGIEAEDGVDALAAAKRELLEETGYGSDEWSHLLTLPAYATITDDTMCLFTAKNCRKINDYQTLDENEFLDVQLYSRDELEELIQNGEFAQASHILALLLSEK